MTYKFLGVPSSLYSLLKEKLESNGFLSDVVGTPDVLFCGDVGLDISSYRKLAEEFGVRLHKDRYLVVVCFSESPDVDTVRSLLENYGEGVVGFLVYPTRDLDEFVSKLAAYALRNF